MFVWFV